MGKMQSNYNRKLLLLILSSSIFVYLINYYEIPGQLSFIKNPPENIYDLLIDYKGFKFKINPRVCSNFQNHDFVIVTVPSASENIDFRKEIRKTWGRWDDEMKVVFFLGLPENDNDNVTRQIRVESDLYGDIVQGNFIDTYRNLSYKHVMILKWVKHHCAEARFIVKIDDDTVVDLHSIYALLAVNKWGKSGVIACYVHPYSAVARKFGYWNISLQEFPYEHYPCYCSGIVIVYSRDVALKLLEASKMVPYYFIEDVYVTGLLAKYIGIRPVDFGLPFMNERKYKSLLTKKSKETGRSPYVIGPTIQNWREIRKLWLTMHRYNFNFFMNAAERKKTKGKIKLATNYGLPKITRRSRKHNVSSYHYRYNNASVTVSNL